MTTGQASQLAAIEAAQAKEKTSGSNSSEDRAPTRQKRGNLAMPLTAFPVASRDTRLGPLLELKKKPVKLRPSELLLHAKASGSGLYF